MKHIHFWLSMLLRMQSIFSLISDVIIHFFVNLVDEQSLNYCGCHEIHRGVEAKSGGTELRARNR